MTIECNVCAQPVMGPCNPVLKVSSAWVDGGRNYFWKINNFFKYKFIHHGAVHTNAPSRLGATRPPLALKCIPGFTRK